MDGSFPSSYSMLDDSDDSDEPQTPVRSSSRLDFCMDPEEDDSPTVSMDWSYTTFRDDCPYTFIKDALAVDIAPLGSPRPLITEGDEDDSPQTPDSHTNQHTDAPPLFFAPPDPMDLVVFEPQSPIPVRPPSVQIQAVAQDSHPPSCIVTQRLNYTHHGLSRSALLHQKSFWNSRHEEWVEWQSRMLQDEQGFETNDAYTGLVVSQPRPALDPPPYMRTPPSGFERDFPPHPSRNRERDIHAPIYPRVGDISALRDSYSVNIDRSFFKLPLWTLHKTLYAFDMHQRAASLSTFACDAANFQASTSSSTLSSYSPSTAGDDEESDSTLVGDSPVPKGPQRLEPLKSALSPSNPTSWNPFCGWDLSWYARWDLLVGIFQDDPTKYDAFTASTKPEAHLESKSSPPSATGRIFRFAVGDEEDGEDEDEDYGMPVADSNFSADFDEECERALAFYHRELR